ncbi:AP-5 complex subunit sigma-1 [Hyperolius riggenbachi]|uniref:AP-5 complex subunit sigma-1 n=1 Tax=Hyperolius riggenbachi TaxID=752182 RepID=UPI0035A2B991
MVYGFVIHTVGASPGEGSPQCRILYSRLFRCHPLDDKLRTDDAALEKERLQRMDQIAIVARQTESMCLLRRQASGGPASDFVIHSGDEQVLLQEEDAGMYGLYPGDPFPQEMTVLWVGVYSLGFSLICDSLDNLTLAESVLRTLVKSLVDSLKILGNSTNVLLRTDRIELTLEKFIPEGHLLFLSHQTVQALERELTTSMIL